MSIPSSHTGRHLAFAHDLAEVFAAFRPAIVLDPIEDFSRLRWSCHPFCEVVPTCTEDLVAIVRLADECAVPFRLRGNGHGLNGASLPHAGELAIRTSALCSVRYEETGTVSAGAGINLWVLNDLVNAQGFSLPIINDGYPGPSVGGFICAGGFGPRSSLYGGFWENVAEMTIVTGNGNLQRLTRDTPLFSWLFGSMGQLGIVADAKLDLATLDKTPPPIYPHDTVVSSSIVKAIAGRHGGAPQADACKRLYWFTLFVLESQEDEALELLTALESRHSKTFVYRERYRYPIRYRKRVAPLIYPHQSSFIAVGAWGFHDDATPLGLQAIDAFERDFMQLALDNGYYRYIQSELPSGKEVYQRYFAPEIYANFLDLRRLLDPKALSNRAWIFEDDYATMA